MLRAGSPIRCDGCHTLTASFHPPAFGLVTALGSPGRNFFDKALDHGEALLHLFDVVRQLIVFELDLVLGDQDGTAQFKDILQTLQLVRPLLDIGRPISLVRPVHELDGRLVGEIFHQSTSG